MADATPRDALRAAVTAAPDADAAIDTVLRHLYWQLREHASAYRDSDPVRQARQRWEENPDDPRACTEHVGHEFYALGVEAAAREISELMGEPEHEIDQEGRPSGG